MLSRKKMFCFLLSLLLSVSLALPAAAAETDDAETDYVSVLDAEELTAMVENYLDEKNLNHDGISISYCYTGTGEIWMYNGDKFSQGASLYKLPLSMGIDNDIVTGVLTEDSKIFNTDVIYALDRMLVYSDNKVAELMTGYFRNVSLRAIGAEMADLSRDVCPLAYSNSNDYSPRLLLGILLELYRHPESYPHVIGCMLRANPKRFFRTTLEGKYGVAQKYGSSSPSLNGAAIIYTPRPFFVSVLTVNLASGENVIGDIGELLADYTLTLDERLDSMDKATVKRAEAQLATVSVSPEKSGVPILTASSSEYYAEATEKLNAAAMASAENAEP